MAQQNPSPGGPETTPAEVGADLNELESLLKVVPPDRDFQPFWSEEWEPPLLSQSEPEDRDGLWGRPVDLAMEFGADPDNEWAYPASTERAHDDSAHDDSAHYGEEEADVPPDRG